MPPESSSRPGVAEEAPSSETLQDYDLLHLVTYLRLLDADAEGADWREVVRIVLGIDAETDPGRAWRSYETHLQRARWLAEHGHAGLLETARRH